ncbi:hypothetical protein HN873_009722, partial [Arachis hypogaea]
KDTMQGHVKRRKKVLRDKLVKQPKLRLDQQIDKKMLLIYQIESKKCTMRRLLRQQMNNKLHKGTPNFKLIM